MKHILLISLTGTLSLLACAQKKNGTIPEKLKTVFAKNHPKAEDAVWEKENGLFEVSYEDQDQEISILYDAEGNEKELEREIQVNELPQTLKDYIAANLKGKKIQEACRITDDKGIVTYELEIKGKDYLLDEKGNLIQGQE